MNEEQREALFKALRPDDETVRALKEKAKATQSVPRRRLLPAAIAAALVLLAALGVWLALRNHQTPPKIEPSDPIVTTTQPPETIPYNPDGSVNYSDLTSDGGAVPAMPQSGALLSVASFFESDVKGCTLCFEGTVTDVQFKQYDYRYYYGVKFGKETYIHEQPVTQLTTFRIEKVWHGDPSLVGTTVTLEDETIQDMGSVFGYRKGVAYVVLMQDVTGYGVDIWHPVGEERLVEGDITRSSPHATFYPWQPQVERAVTGDYIVPTTWKTVTEGCSVKVILEPDALQDSHTAHMLDWFGDQLRLVKADVFRARMAALIAE
jgi:hypothetical protein